MDTILADTVAGFKMTLPDAYVVGLPVDDALNVLRRAGLRGVQSPAQAVRDVCSDLVVAQRPTASASRPDDLSVQLTPTVNTAQTFFNMTCRGDLLVDGAGRSPYGLWRLVFTMRQGGTGPASNGLQTRQCTWDDRAFRAGEPTRVQIDLTIAQRRTVLATLARPDGYIVFRAVNSGECFQGGCLLSGDAKPPGPPQASSAAQPLASLLADFFGTGGPAGPDGNARGARMLAAAFRNDPDLLALALAVVKNESGDFEPRTEQPNQSNTRAGNLPFDLYEPASPLGKSLGNTDKGDGERYRGRGLLMIWGKANYARYGQLVSLGDQLVREPALAADFKIAIAVLEAAVREIAPKLKRPIDADGVRTAQRLINGSLTPADKLVRNFEAAKPLANALLQANAVPANQSKE